MSLRFTWSFGIALVAGAFVAMSHAQDAVQYPSTKKVEVVEDHFGTSIADPYRWLESLDSEETAAWIAAQNALTFA